jgi:hypothetical protein
MAKLRSTKSVAVGASIHPLTLARLGVLARDNNRTISAEISFLLDGVLDSLKERILEYANQQSTIDTQRGKTDPRTPARLVLKNLADQIAAAPAVPAADIKAQPGPQLVPPVSAPTPASIISEVDVEPSKEQIQEVEVLIKKANELLNSGASVEVVVEETNLSVEAVENLIELRKKVNQKRAEQLKTKLESKLTPVQSTEPPTLHEPKRVLDELLPPEQRGPHVVPAYAQPVFAEPSTETEPAEVAAPPIEEKKVPEGNPPAPDSAPIVDNAPADPLPPGKGLPIGLLGKLSREKD